jgi:hypothetical protein
MMPRKSGIPRLTMVVRVTASRMVWSFWSAAARVVWIAATSPQRYLSRHCSLLPFSKPLPPFPMRAGFPRLGVLRRLRPVPDRSEVDALGVCVVNEVSGLAAVRFAVRWAALRAVQGVTGGVVFTTPTWFRRRRRSGGVIRGLPRGAHCLTRR